MEIKPRSVDEDVSMKKSILLLFALLVLLPAFTHAEDFLGAPVIPGGKVINKTANRLEIETHMTHDQVLSFYKEALKKEEDVKFRDWKDQTYIEDDGNRPWHSINISKGDQQETTVTIMKDNWTWIVGTLILRFVGVFFVLLVLFLGMAASGGLISRIIKKSEAKKAEAKA
jgi:hypothetical protein